MKLRRNVSIAIAAAGIALALYWGFLPKPVLVETAQARTGPLVVSVEEEGRTRVRDRFVVSSPVTGYLRRIGLDVGDPVKKGETVARLEPQRSPVLDPRARAEAEARVRAAEAALLSARETREEAAAEAELAGRELKRIRELHGAGFVPQESLDEAEARWKAAGAKLRSMESAVEVARFELEAARATLRYGAERRDARVVSVNSPVSGRVLKVVRESEGTVLEGDPLIEIGDPASLEVEVDVLSSEAVRIRPGGRVLFERWGGEAPLEGKVRTIEPAGFTKISALGVEEQRVLVISDITSAREAWQGLGDGYRVEARFIIWEGAALQVPSSALFRYDGGWAVFVKEGKRARLRRVDVGKRGGLVSEVLSGVKEGEDVITHPPDAVEDGTRVRTRR